MNKKNKITLAVFIFCILCNFSPLSIVFHFFTNEGYYQYSNYNGSNTTEQGLLKGGDFGRIERIHQSWVDENPKAPDKKLYRAFWRNPLAFWRWRSYFFDKRYDLPYKDKDEIIAVRKKYKGNLKRYHTAF